MKRGLPSWITAEKIEKLKSVGFVFLTRKSPLDNLRKKREREYGLTELNEDDMKKEKKIKVKHNRNNDDDDDDDDVDGGDSSSDDDDVGGPQYQHGHHRQHQDNYSYEAARAMGFEHFH